MSDAATAAAAASAATATAAATTPAWHDGMSADVLGKAQLKGWDLTNPRTAFESVVGAYTSAESYVGAPPEQLVRLPKDPNDATGWKQVWQRLGAPDKPEAYTFEGVDIGGPELTTKFVEGARKLASDLGMPKAHAEGFAQFMAKFVGEQRGASEVTYANTLANEKVALAKDWGQEGTPDWESNQFIARQGAKALGVDADTVAALEKAMGFSKVMQMFHKVGVANKEDSFVVNPGGGNKPLTREMALARYTELMGAAPGMMPMKGSGDAAWQKRYQEGGTTSAEFKELQALLNRINA